MIGPYPVVRYQWKVDLIEETKNRAKDPPVPILTMSQLDNVFPGRRLVLRGRFDHSKEVLLGLRSAPVSLYPAAQGMASNPQVRDILVLPPHTLIIII
jgi:cytochrome oxidase assembly protein ShyY1